MATSTETRKIPKRRATRADCPLSCGGEMQPELTTERVKWFRCDTCGRALEGEPRGRAA